MDERLRAIVAQRIRRLRLESGAGLREQARAIGISASSLSSLENNRGGVSLRRLQQVANHFGLHITDLLAETDQSGESEQTVEIFRDCAATVPSVQRRRGVVYQLIGAGRGHVLQPYLLAFEPGGTYGDDMIGHPGEEFDYVLYGRVELLLNSEVYPLEQGDCVRFRTESPHAFRNASSTGIAIVLGAATPPW